MSYHNRPGRIVDEELICPHCGRKLLFEWVASKVYCGSIITEVMCPFCNGWIYGPFDLDEYDLDRRYFLGRTD